MGASLTISNQVRFSCARILTDGQRFRAAYPSPDKRRQLLNMALTYALHSRLIRPDGSLTDNELIMAEGEATEPKTMDELTALANDLMAGMESTFESASAGITDRLDEVGAKLDEIETNVGDLMTQLGVDADEPAAAESES